MELLLQTDAALDQDRLTMQFVIVALLLVALLLGLLTIWYWKQTDPRKAAARQRASQAGATPQPFSPEPDGFQFQRPETLAANSNVVGSRPVVSQGPGRAPTANDGDDAWASLTSAEPDTFEKPYS